MKIDPANAAASTRHRGRAVHCCSKGCREKFEADPDRYLPATSKALPMTGPTQVQDLVVDPVCGMKVDPATARGGSHEYQGKTYYFCGKGCQAKFATDPERYLKGTPSLAAMGAPMVQSAPKGAAYVCPMDPEVRSDKPGACPKCGMALEPEEIAAPRDRTEYVCPMHAEIVRSEPGACPVCGMALEPRLVAAVEEENPDLVDMTRRFYIATALTVPVFLMAMGEMLPGAALRGLMSSTTQEIGRAHV